MRSTTLSVIVGAASLLWLSGPALAGDDHHKHGHSLGHSHHHVGAHCPHTSHRVTVISNPYHSRRILGHHASRSGHHNGYYGHHYRAPRPTYYGRSSRGYLSYPAYHHGHHETGRSSFSYSNRSFGLSLYSRY